jgi:hypothetical protein
MTRPLPKSAEDSLRRSALLLVELDADLKDAAVAQRLKDFTQQVHRLLRQRKSVAIAITETH